MAQRTFAESKQHFINTVEAFNQKYNRHVEIVGDYQSLNKPIELYEKTVINGKIYENRWTQAPANFEAGHEGNPFFNTGEADFIMAIDEFNQKNNRHVEMVGEYQNLKTPVEFYEKSVINGKIYENRWTQVPKNFKQGHERNPLFSTGEADFIIAVDEFNKQNNRHIEIIGKYKNSSTPVELHEKSVINGKTHEEHWRQRPCVFMRGDEGNPLFNTGKADLIIAVDEFNQKNNRHVEIVGEYQNANTPVEFYEKSVINGKTYEERWKQNPCVFMRGSEGNPLFKTGKADFIVAIDEFNKKNNRHVEMVGEYQNSRTQVELYEKTVINGKTYENRWYQTSHGFNQGHDGNPLFNTGQADFIVAVDEFNKKYNRHVEIVGDYQSLNKPIKLYEKTVINGKIYENRWTQAPANFEAGHEGNPLFQAIKGTSFLQEFLYDVFSQYFVPKGYSVSNRDTSLFDNYDGHPMELDIVVYDENHNPKMALEPGAWYHHQNRVEHDIEKLSICNDNDLYCLLIYFGTESEYKQAIETESIKNYKSENPDIQDNIWIYPNKFTKPTCQKEKDNLTNLVDALGRLMGVENLSKQPEINIDEAIDHADANMHQSERNTEKTQELESSSENETPVSRPVPAKFEEMLKVTEDKDTDIFEI